MLRIFVITVLLALAMGGLHAQDGDPAQEMDPESPYETVTSTSRERCNSSDRTMSMMGRFPIVI